MDQSPMHIDNGCLMLKQWELEVLNVLILPIQGWLEKRRLPQSDMPVVSADVDTGDEEETSKFMKQLPPEIQEQIFRELPITSVLKCRQVCSAWCDLIDSCLEFSVVFSDATNDYVGVEFPPWRIFKCFIGSYVDDNLEFLPHPGALRVLNIWGSITNSNFLRILGQSLNLEELSLANQALSYNRSLFELNGVPQQINLDKLRKFTLYSKESFSSIEKNLLYVLRQSMPNLRTLKILVDHGPYDVDFLDTQLGIELATNIALFVSQKRQLNTINLTIPAFKVAEEVVNRLVIELNGNHNLEKNLARLKIRNCRFRVPPIFTRLFRQLFELNLKDIRLEIPYLGGIPTKFSSLERYIRPSLPSFLVSIHIQWLRGHPSSNDDAPIDFSIFQFAENLKRIALAGNPWRSEDSDENQQFGVIANLHHLPPSIEVLELDGFRCRSDEIKLVANSLYLRKLSVIQIINSGGYQLGFGIDGSVAQALCSKRSLQLLTIGPLKNSMPWASDPEFPILRDVLRCTDFEVRNNRNVVTYNFEKFRRLCASKAKKAMYGRKLSCTFNLLATTL